MAKTHSKQGTKGNFLNLIQRMYEKFTANIVFNGERLNTFLPKNRNKTRMSAFTTSIQHCTGDTSQSNKARKRNKKQRKK